MSNGVKLSVVIPARNEERRIEKTLQDVDTYLQKQNYGYEIIVVDGNSNDRTVEIVEKLAATLVPHLRVIVEKQNHGKGGAVKRGVLESVGDYVMFMDADNATPISEIEKF